MSKAFTSGDVVTPEVVRPLPVGRRPLTEAGMATGRAHLQRLLAERTALEARRARGEADLTLVIDALSRKLMWHERRLSLSDVAPRPVAPVLKASLGVRISVRDEDTGVSAAYTLVGPDEVDAARGRVSHLSPVGQALWQRKVGERTFIKRPKGISEVVIEALAIDSTLEHLDDEPAASRE